MVCKFVELNLEFDGKIFEIETINITTLCYNALRKFELINQSSQKSLIFFI